MFKIESPWSRRLRSSLTAAALGAISISSIAQQAATESSNSVGTVEDWSFHHVLFSNPGTEQDALRNGRYNEWLRIVNEPRFMMQQRKRSASALKPTLVAPAEGLSGGFGASAPFMPQPRLGGSGRTEGHAAAIVNASLKRDWSMNNGGFSAAALTITVSSAPASGTVSTSSTVTVDGQTFTTAAPATAQQTGTFAGEPASGQTVTITNGSNVLTLTVGAASTATVTFAGEPSANATIGIGTATFEFETGGTGCGTGDICVARSATHATDASNFEAAVNANLTNVIATVASNVVTLTNATAAAISISSSKPTQAELDGGTTSPVSLAAPTATDGNGCASGSSIAGTFLNEGTAAAEAAALAAAITNCNAAKAAVGVSATSSAGTVTVTADAAGTTGNSIALAEGLTNFTWSAATLSAGTNGPGDSATTFNYWNGNAYDTESQLATDLATAFGENTTLAESVTSLAATNTVVLTAVSLGSVGNSLTASDSGFTALTIPNSGEFSGGGGGVPANIFPAKFSFFTSSTPSCSDYVVYPTGDLGTSATIMAYYNIYATTCTGTVPKVAWAYYTGGTSALSPVLSLDGSQVAYIQTSSNVASLVLLKPSATSGGTIGSPASISSVSLSAYRSCAAPCYTTLTLSGSPNDTNSSPFYVYSSADALYVGDNSGVLHQFTGVFLGTPAESTGGTSGSGWPTTVSTETSPILTSPVFDSGGSNLIFVADATGYLHSVPATGGSSHVLTSNQMECGTDGFVDPPIVDSTAENAFIFVGDGCNGAPSPSYVNRFKTTTSIGGTYGQNAANYGNASTNDSATIQHAGTFDNQYFASGGASGNIYGCVNGRIYQTPIASLDGTTQVTPNTFSTPVTSVADVSACSPMTEFLGVVANTTINESGGISAGSGTVIVASGAGITNNDYIQIDSEIMEVTGGGGTTSLTITRAQDGTAAASHANSAAVEDVKDWVFTSVQANGNATISPTCNGACLYNYNVTSGAVTGNPLAGISSAGGSTGIVIDNSGTAAGESQIYYLSLGSQACSGNGSTGSGSGLCAVQTSQSAP
jgi:hypothetical protein